MTRTLIPLLLVVFVFGFTVRSPSGEKSVPATPTFAEHIAPIIFNNCTFCHRPGEAAPFSFLRYRDVEKRGRLIRKVTKSRYMPPWHPVPGHGEFLDDRRLDKKDIELIDRWVETGMKLGDEKKIPPVPDFPEGWQLGKPDLVVSMAKAYEVHASGPDIYRNFAIALNLDEDKWVKAVEIRPSARTVVHHSLFYLDDSGTALKLDGKNGTPGFRGMGFRRSGSLGGWAVGATARFYADDLARPLPKGSDLVLSTHFHPSGKLEHEKTTIGLYFTEKPPSRTMTGFQVPPLFGRMSGLDVPAGKKDFKISGTFKVPVDIELLSIGGHAHYICTQMKARATLPDGRVKSLFYVDDWDFNWQGRYQYQNAIKLPAGTVVDAELTYDNSEDNPENPNNPPKRIRWGLQSTDEMGSVIFNAVPVNQEDYAALKASIRSQRFTGRGVNRQLGGLADRLKGLDKNKDGKISKDEIPRELRRLVLRLDTNKDGVIDEEELKALSRP